MSRRFVVMTLAFMVSACGSYRSGGSNFPDRSAPAGSDFHGVGCGRGGTGVRLSKARKFGWQASPAPPTATAITALRDNQAPLAGRPP